MNAPDLIKLLTVIVDRGKGGEAAALLQGRSLPFNYICLGQGTANSQILDYLGLGETRKDVVFSLVPGGKAKSLLTAVGERLQFSLPGRGIAFVLPLSGVSQAVSGAFDGTQQKEEDKSMENAKPYSLLVAVVNHGYSETVVSAAKAGGARGGTLIHARRAEDNAGSYAIQPEQEVVIILAPQEQRLAIMKEINLAAGPATEARGVLFSLPVEEMMGLR